MGAPAETHRTPRNGSCALKAAPKGAAFFCDHRNVTFPALGSASAGFLAYSWLVANWVFVVTNAALLVTAIVGELIYKRNAREARTNCAADVGRRESRACESRRA